MKRYVGVLLFIMISYAAQAQLGTRSFDPALYGAGFTIDTSRCGIYIANQWILPTSPCEVDEEPQPDSLLAFLEGFTCTDFMQTLEPQHCMLEFNIDKEGQVMDVRASNARDGLLEYEVSEYCQQMPDWEPGTCAGNPSGFRILFTLYFYPGP